jgi:hypothetical protein
MMRELEILRPLKNCSGAGSPGCDVGCVSLSVGIPFGGWEGDLASASCLASSLGKSLQLWTGELEKQVERRDDVLWPVCGGSAPHWSAPGKCLMYTFNMRFE